MFKKLLYSIMLIPFLALCGQEPVLTITHGDQSKDYRLNDLLSRKDLEIIHVQHDPAYKKQSRDYQAVQAAALFEGIAIDNSAIIQFQTTDGFSAPISKEQLLNRSPEKSIAYIAIESPKAPWPELGAGKPSAGPFYLIWKNPSLSKIGREQWPYMLSGFVILDDLRRQYPGIHPDKKIPLTDPINMGFQVFMKQCFACHTMNHQGGATMGPDLNLPMNPIEYFQETALRKLIRDPKQVRSWPDQKMHGFSEAEISNQELDDLIEYLKHMNTHKL